MLYHEENDMKRSWLVQRLHKPYKMSEPDAAGNPFAFGGGLLRGGLNEEASKMLGTAFNFDYMGAAEYEFGAVPEALNKVLDHAKNGELVLDEIEVPLLEVVPRWNENKLDPDDVSTGRVWILAKGSHMPTVKERVNQWARNEFNTDRAWKTQYEVRDTIGLGSTLRTDPEAEDAHWRSYGWLELDNGFFFFADETMARATAALFGVGVEEEDDE